MYNCNAQRIGFLRKASNVLDLRGKITAFKGFVRPVMEYCPLVWSGAATCHLSRLNQVQKRALSLIGQGTIIDSLAIRRTVSGLCFLFKLQCCPRLPTLQSLVPPQLVPVQNARTRRQATVTHHLQLSTNLPAKSNDRIRRSFPYGVISEWNNIPPAILGDEPRLKDLQRFKVNVYKHLQRSDWLWATDSL